MKIKQIVTAGCLAAGIGTAHAGEMNSDWEMNRDGARTEFISYNIRLEAEGRDLANSVFYLDLSKRANAYVTSDGKGSGWIVEPYIPFQWLDREIYLHVEGVAQGDIYLDDKLIGRMTDSRMPFEMHLSPFAREGVNNLRIEKMQSGPGIELEQGLPPAPGQPVIYLWSQPKLCIRDMAISAAPDSTGKAGELKVDVLVSNSYNMAETVTIGIDIYSPEGKLLLYNLKDIKVVGHGVDTLRFTETVYGAMQRLWSPQTPFLYNFMVYLKYQGRIIEYIPYRVGFTTFGYDPEKGLVRNGVPVNCAAARYNAVSLGQARKDIEGLKLRGINTVCPDAPQKAWFYELCDSIGMNVVDRVNINAPASRDDRKVGGTPTNDPAWLPLYLVRMRGEFARNRNHACIAAWSIGRESSNGYNMYKSYELLKGLEPSRAVVYPDAGGEWDSDLSLPAVREASEVLAQPLPATAKPGAKPAVKR